MSSFADFLNYIIEHKEDSEYEPNALLDVFVNFIEPFAAENDVEIPDELNQLIEAICDLEDDKSECTETSTESHIESE